MLTLVIHASEKSVNVVSAQRVQGQRSGRFPDASINQVYPKAARRSGVSTIRSRETLSHDHLGTRQAGVASPDPRPVQSANTPMMRSGGMPFARSVAIWASPKRFA